MIDTTTTCDICGRVKQECNHWFIAFTFLVTGRITFGLGYDRDFVPSLGNKRDLVPDDQRFVIQDICGQECAHTRLSQFLDSLNTAATERPRA